MFKFFSKLPKKYYPALLLLAFIGFYLVLIFLSRGAQDFSLAPFTLRNSNNTDSQDSPGSGFLQQYKQRAVLKITSFYPQEQYVYAQDKALVLLDFSDDVLKEDVTIYTQPYMQLQIVTFAQMPNRIGIRPDSFYEWKEGVKYKIVVKSAKSKKDYFLEKPVEFEFVNYSIPQDFGYEGIY